MERKFNEWIFFDWNTYSYINVSLVIYASVYTGGNENIIKFAVSIVKIGIRKINNKKIMISDRKLCSKSLQLFWLFV